MQFRAGRRPKVTHCVTLPRPSQIRIRGVPIHEIAAIIGAGKSRGRRAGVGTQPALIHPQVQDPLSRPKVGPILCTDSTTTNLGDVRL